MGTNTLNNRSAGQTILDTFFNDIHQAVNGDFVGRNTSGVPAASQNLGTTALPWGVIRADSLVLDGESVDTSQLVSQPNRVISGKVRTTSNQPAFITPNGAAASFIIYGSTTSLVLDINGAAVSVTTDISVGSLTVAPASNNTCLSNDAAAADQHDTKVWGEFGQKKIIVDTMGSNISALVGKYAAFRLAGVSTEYFVAYVESTTVLSRAKRGYFYDSSLNPINRTGFSNNDVITLMSLAWIFVENNGTTASVTYTNPVWDFTAPSSPATNDYWYDTTNDVWKRYDGASWVIINRTFVGWAVIDGTNCVAARCEDFYYKPSKDANLNLEINSTSIILASNFNAEVNVHGSVIKYRKYLPRWNMTTNLATSVDMYDATEQASRFYYLYITDYGYQVISDISPYYEDNDGGRYHPHNPWRCVGVAFNDGSSNLVNVRSIDQSITDKLFACYYATANFATTTAVPINFDTAEYDTHGCVVPSATVWKFIAPWSGFFTFDLDIYITSGTNTGWQLYKNTVNYKSIGNISAASGVSATPSVTVLLAAGDTVDIRPLANQTVGGGTLSAQNTSKITIKSE